MFRNPKSYEIRKIIYTSGLRWPARSCGTQAARQLGPAGGGRRSLTLVVGGDEAQDVFVAQHDRLVDLHLPEPGALVSGGEYLPAIGYRACITIRRPYGGPTGRR